MKSSGLLGASAVIFPKPCCLRGITLKGDTGKEPSLTIYDNATEASGTEQAVSMVSDECHCDHQTWEKGEKFCSSGIYASLSAAEGDYIVDYDYD